MPRRREAAREPGAHPGITDGYLVGLAVLAALPACTLLAPRKAG